MFCSVQSSVQPVTHFQKAQSIPKMMEWLGAHSSSSNARWQPFFLIHWGGAGGKSTMLWFRRWVSVTAGEAVELPAELAVSEIPTVRKPTKETTWIGPKESAVRQHRQEMKTKMKTNKVEEVKPTRPKQVRRKPRVLCSSKVVKMIKLWQRVDAILTTNKPPLNFTV